MLIVASQKRALVKRSAKAEIERVQALAQRSARLKRETDELHAKSKELRLKAEKARERVAQLDLKQKTASQPVDKKRTA